MKPNLLLLHGALGSKNQFGAIEEELSNNFEVYTLNFEGHGGLSSRNPFSIQLFANNVMTFLSENKLTKTSIFGYSMGGYVALQLAIKAPDMVEKISTLGTKFDWNKVSAAKEIQLLNPEIIEEKIPRFAKRLHQEHFPENWKVVMSKTASMMLQMGEGSCLKENDFERIQQHVTIAVGSLDEMVTVEESKHVVASIPNAKFKLLNEVQHPINKIKANLLVDYIKSTLE